MKSLLDNITWHTLVGPHAKYAVGIDDVRRYAPGFSPILGFLDNAKPNFSALTNFSQPGEQFYCEGWSGTEPFGWKIETESTMHKMIWESEIPENEQAMDAVALKSEHAAQALELATLTRPGPFGIRTIELGEYFGYFEGSKLIAMAGERMCAGAFHEISGVCTHPDFQGRGLAKKLMLKLIRRQMLRDKTSFLHVMSENIHARHMYERMGFKHYRETIVRVVSKA